MATPHPARKIRGRRRPLALEAMERRMLLASFVVSNNSDSGNGSLRAAIIGANAVTDPNEVNTITFSLPATQLTIAVATPLPTVAHGRTSIDASGNAGATGNPQVVLTPQSTAAASAGLTFTGGQSTVRSLIIDGFSGPGIVLSNNGSNIVQNTWIGVNASGTAAAANAGDGIQIGSANNTIGGSSAGQGNILSGNTGSGISISGAIANLNVIQGNLIGVGFGGTAAVANILDGINVNGGANNTIGGASVGARNTISGNTRNGVTVSGSGNSLFNNYIGTSQTGTAAVPNTAFGVAVSGTTTTIGGSGSLGNIISGNLQAGIGVTAGTGTLIRGNLIGLGLTGTTALAPLGNSQEGIFVGTGAANVVIGGSTAFANTIAYNGSGTNPPTSGVSLATNVTSTSILSNSIFSNAGGGIRLAANANNNQPAPVITTAQTGAGQTRVTGQLSFPTQAGQQFIIEFYTNSTADPAGQFEGQNFLGSVTVTADASGVAPINVTLPAGSNVGDTITATATQNNTRTTSQFSAGTTITQAQVAGVSVSISPSIAAPVPLGSLETYTITVSNSGPNPATNVAVNSTFNTNTAIISTSSSQGTSTITTPTTVQSLLGTIAANTTATITVVVTSTATGTLTIRSTATADQLDPNSADNTASLSLAVVNAANLGVLVNSDPNPVGIGSMLTYVVTAVNTGPSPATNVAVTETLPTGVTFTSAQTDIGTYTMSGNVITYTIPSLASGGTGTLTIVVQAPASLGTLTNTATITSDTADPDTSNNSATNLTTVRNVADLSVTGVASPNPAFTSEPLTYTFTVTNNGPSNSASALFQDVLPAGVSYTSATSSQGTVSQSGGTVSANLGPLANGATATITITVQPTGSGSVSNTATVSTPNEIDGNSSNDSAQVVVLVNPTDLSISLSASPQPAFVGSNLTYVLTVVNGGPADATGVVATDTLPAGATVISFASSVGSISESSGIITGTIGNLAAGASATITIVVAPTASGPILDSAKVTGNQVDPNPANNAASSTVVVSPADVSVAVAASTSTLLVGNPLTFTYTVTNSGPATADNVVLTSKVPSGATFSSASTGTGSFAVLNGVLTATLGSLPSGASSTVTIIVIPTTVGNVVSTGTVTATQFDPVSGNNSATSTVAATNAPGTFQFSSPTFVTNESAGSVLITINRTLGTLGAVTVGYSTFNGTALAGVNYVTTGGTVVFAAGQTTATISIPLINDGQITPDLNFGVALTSVNGGGVLGAIATANVIERNTNFDLIPPTVTAVTPIYNGRAITGFVVTFSEAVTPNSAGYIGNYTIATSDRESRNGIASEVTIVAAYYNPATKSVALVTARPLPLNAFYRVTADGNGVNPITDLYGNKLDGNGDGVAGGDYATYVGLGTNLSYLDATLDRVNVKVSRGGLIQVNRFANGEGQSLHLLGAVPYFTRLTGTVRKSTGRGLGLTTFQSITGLGAFGQVYTTLTTPPFYVATPAFTAPLVLPTTPPTGTIPIVVTDGTITPRSAAVAFRRR